MRTFLRPGSGILPLIVLLMLPLAACEVQEGGEDEAMPEMTDPAEVRSAIDEANRGALDLLNVGDVAGFVDAVYTEDAVILPPGGPRMEGREAITGFWQDAHEQMGIRTVDLHTTDVETLGPDRAWEIGRWTIATEEGEAQGKYLVIWQRDDQGAWRWDVDIWNEGAEGMDTEATDPGM